MNKLFVVPTPIGNLEDITLRAIQVLKDIDTLIVEDTRISIKILKHLNISKRMLSFHKFNEHNVLKDIVKRIVDGEKMALISDAGTPGISDPGFMLIRELLKNNIDVECLPGATALIPALVVSGLPSDRFVFEGFLPHKKGRQKRLKELQEETRTMIFYESPFRILKTLEQFIMYFTPVRKASISREISKIHEETIRGTLEELYNITQHRTLRGEIVICVAGKNKD